MPSEPAQAPGDSDLLALLHANATATNVGYMLAYAAPEQVRGERSTAATDVHGFTALACRLLGGDGPPTRVLEEPKKKMPRCAPGWKPLEQW